MQIHQFKIFWSQSNINKSMPALLLYIITYYTYNDIIMYQAWKQGGRKGCSSLRRMRGSTVHTKFAAQVPPVPHKAPLPPTKHPLPQYFGWIHTCWLLHLYCIHTIKQLHMYNYIMNYSLRVYVLP